MFESIFTNGTVAAVGFFVVLGVALICGIIYAFLACYKSSSSTNFLICTALLPMAVAAVIALVNGNLGVGVAIAGAFGLVRFRSAQGNAREIAVIFIAVASGLAFGTGYIAYGSIFLLGSGLLLFVFGKIAAKTRLNDDREKIIKITIPEALDYTTVFDDIFDNYAENYRLEGVKSVNMGSMFKLTYRTTLKCAAREKEMLDAIRTRNGNLEIQCLRADTINNDL